MDVSERVVAAPGDMSYHRMARAELDRWGHPLVGTLLVLVLGLFGSVLVGGALVISLPDRPACAQTSTNLRFSCHGCGPAGALHVGVGGGEGCAIGRAGR
jgi:hypothetical protein